MSQGDLFSPDSPGKPKRPARKMPKIISVRELNRHAKALVESMGVVWVEGEISNLARPASGHVYFSLKDAQSQVRCAWFRGAQRGLAAKQIADGAQVLLRARPSLYEGRGEFQLIVEHAEPAGEGALRLAFEALKTQLEREGLFDLETKKPLPRLPRRVGLITSASGSVLHDILTTFGRRFASIALVIYPVPVQGEDAADSIAATIALANKRAEVDALILARGGGSLEDLWAFNEEAVARAIFASTLPIVTGIGHETDTTIADWVADSRAPTPTAAAELLSPDASEWDAAYSGLAARLTRLMAGRLNEARQSVDWLYARLVHPRTRLATLAQDFDHLEKRLRLAMNQHRHGAAMRLDAVSARLHASAPPARIAHHQAAFSAGGQRLVRALAHTLDHKQLMLGNACVRLDALSPLATLSRGYAIIKDDQGKVVRDAANIKIGERLHARLGRGRLSLNVEKTHAEED